MPLVTASRKKRSVLPGPTVKFECRVMSKAQHVTSPHEHSLGKAFIHNHLLLLHLDTFLKVWERFCEGSWPSRQTDSHQGAKFTLQANPDFHELPHYKSRCSHAQEMMNVPQAGPPSWHLSEGSSPCSARWLPAWQYLCTLILQLK